MTTASFAEPSTLQLLDRSDVIIADRAQLPHQSLCPHCVTRVTSVGTLPICTALPVYVPISPSRMRTHCTGVACNTCPHFIYGVEEARLDQAGPSTASVLRVWLSENFGDSLWVVGIPLTIMIVIITALFLTQ